MIILSKRLKHLRAKRNVTQRQVAQNCLISLRALKYYEAGERIPNAEIIVKFCKYFNVTADYLLGLSDIITKESDLELELDL